MKTWMFRISIAWLLAAIVLVAGYWTKWIPSWQSGYYGISVLLFSFISFLCNAFDKFQARREGWRISEKWLHALEFLGGWPGAHFGQQIFRHKTDKKGYRRIFWIIVLLHFALLVAAVYFSVFPSSQR